MSLINRIKKAWDVLTGSDQPEVEQSNKPSIEEATSLNEKMDELLKAAIRHYITNFKPFKAEVNCRVHRDLFYLYQNTNVKFDNQWTGFIHFDGTHTSGYKFVHTTQFRDRYMSLVQEELVAQDLLAEWQAQQQDKGCVNV